MAARFWPVEHDLVRWIRSLTTKQVANVQNVVDGQKVSMRKKASNEGRAGKKEKVPKLQVGKVRFRPLWIIIDFFRKILKTQKILRFLDFLGKTSKSWKKIFFSKNFVTIKSRFAKTRIEPDKCNPLDL